MENEDIDIPKYRITLICPRCKKEKRSGCIVCWNCWRDKKNPFKYFNGTLREYLAKK